MRFTWVSITLAVVLTGMMVDFSAALTFAPKIGGSYGILGVEALLENDRTESSTNIHNRERVTFREVLEVGMGGFSYHPNFMTFIAKGSMGLEEEKINDSLFTTSDWTTTSTEAYELRAFFLPKHPYNLELFTIQETPLLVGRLATTNQIERRQSGALFNYKKRPWAGALQYINDEIIGSNSFEVDHYRGKISFAPKYFTISGGYDYSDSVFNNGDTAVKELVRLNNNIRVKTFTLGSEWSIDKEDKNFENDIFSDFQRTTWIEKLSLDLPWNFYTSCSYREDNDDSREENANTAEQTTRFSYTDYFTYDITHYLYNSLRSRYSFNRIDIDSSGGTSKQENWQLNFGYKKKIANSYLSTRYYTGKNFLDRQGPQLVINEVQKTTTVAPHTFTLFNRDVDTSTIEITVRDPDNANLTMSLELSTHFFFTVMGTFVEITITSLPALFDINLADTYDFLVTYNLKPADFVVKTKVTGYSMQLNLYGDLLVPYYSHSESRPIFTEGELLVGIIADHVVTDTVGLRYTPTPFSFKGEYSNTDSIVDPKERWTVQGRYQKNITPLTALHIGMERENETYLVSVPGIADQTFITERSYSGSVSLRKQNERKNLVATIGTNYAKSKAIFENTNYGFASTLEWRVGKMNVNLRGSYIRGKAMGRDYFNKTTDTLIYLKIRRKLF